MAQFEEPVCDEPRGRSVSDPVVDVGLLQVLKRDLAVVEPVKEVDRDSDGLLAAEEGAVGHRL
jgi:hypothetical protein